MKEQFERDGYLVVRGLIPREIVEDVRDLLETHVERSTDELMKRLGANSREEMFAKLDDLQRSERAQELDLQIMNVARGLFPLEVRMSGRLRAVPSAKPVRETVAHLLGSDELFIHMPPTARHIAKGNRVSPVPAHQDIAYNKHMSDFITMWTPFVPINDECGGVGIYTDSNAQREIEVAQQGFWLGGIETTGSETIFHPHLQPGDVVFLNKWILHQSMPNTSARTRISIDYRFFARPNTSTKHHLEIATGVVHEPKDIA